METVWGSASKTGLSAGLTGGPEPGQDSLRPPLDSLQDHLWSISTGSSQNPLKVPSKPTSRTLSRTFLQTFLDLADLIYRPPFGPLCIRTTSSASSLSPKNSACYWVVCCMWWRWSGLETLSPFSCFLWSHNHSLSRTYKTISSNIETPENFECVMMAAVALIVCVGSVHRHYVNKPNKQLCCDWLCCEPGAARISCRHSQTRPKAS